MCDLKGLTAACGDPNPAGIKSKIYLASAGDVTNSPKLKSDMTPAGTNAGDGATIGEVYTMASGKLFKEFTIIPLSGEVTDTLVGEVGGKTFESTFDFMIAGTKADQLEFAKCIANGCLIAIVPEKSGQRRVLGDKDDHAFVESIVLKTGKKGGDVRAGTYQIKSVQGYPAPVYDAALAIPLAI